MENRPEFSNIKTFEEFSKYYWYRDELKRICKEIGIDSSGMKADLNHNIEEYFKGNIVPENKKSNSVKEKNTSPDIELTLDTSLVECGFKFSQRFRDFFSAQTGIKNFKFNVDMVATAKKVKEEKNDSFTLGDLLDVYYGRKEYAKYDNSSLQWNNFVKDFCADEATNSYVNKLKVASILWNEVRNSTREKVYKGELLEEFAEKIEIYRL